MISALVLGSVAMLGPVSAPYPPLAAPVAPPQLRPADPALFELGQTGELELLVRASATQLQAVNPTPHPIYLRFADEERGVHAGLLLPPGTQLEARFPAGTLEGLWLEAVSFDAQGRHGTGALPLDELLVEGVRALWIDRTASELADLSTWIVDGAGRTLLPPEKSMLKPPGLSSAPHVPGVTPHDNQRRMEAPKLSPKPLPPL